MSTLPPDPTPADTRRSFLGKLAAAGAVLTLGRFFPAGAAAATPAWVKGMALDITFSVATAASGRVKRPYVAVWIEDSAGKPVRTLSLWVQTTGRGPRWIPDLRRWYRGNSDLLDTVSSATRNPGTYAVAWDGKTDRGAVAPRGDYYVCIESAREHGPYSLVREKVTLGASAFKKDLGTDGDIGAARVSYARA
ncbi:DUF2271 domain-containing protein [Deinococcus sp. SDU3-2]|uniref:DUF2271 domain-containing protein n=1 Tax=Deinococcus terrestris TaxID=2651870 RepID=A0A7X1TQE1_9DEIO|nr:DUF2271 domain-containing protein [Deinococcus terrestris]MPY65351.1 DUF2271 domain-containing protein [Deinococcus terrestris]